MWQDLWIPPTFLPHLGLLCWPFFHLLTCGYPKNTCLLPWLVSFHYLFFHSENIIEPMHEARHSAKHRDNWSSPNTLILAGFLCYTPHEKFPNLRIACCDCSPRHSFCNCSCQQTGPLNLLKCSFLKNKLISPWKSASLLQCTCFNLQSYHLKVL